MLFTKVLAFTYLMTCFLYFQTENNHVEHHDVLLLFIIFFSQSLLLYGMYFLAKKYTFKLTKVFIVLAILARCIVIPSSPILEDDFYRYLWDGHVLKNKINPYKYAPISEKLDHINTDYRENIGYINIATIYPPVAQYIFAANSYLGGHLIGLKIIFVIFDLLTALIIFKWLRLRGLPSYLNLFYLFNPLIIKEIANSAHLDSVLAFFFTLSLYMVDKLFLSNKQTTFINKYLSSLSLGLATLIKLSPIFALPAVLKYSKNKTFYLIGLLLTLFIFTSPFMLSDKMMPGLFSFAKHWVINESLFYPISYFASQLVVIFDLAQIPMLQKYVFNEVPGKLMSASILGLIIIYFYFKKNIHIAQYALIIIVSLLLLSPVFNPWYVLWFLPFSIVSKHHPTILLSLLLVLSYSFYLPDKYYQAFRLLEYLVFFSFLAYWHFRKKVILK